MPKLLDHEVPMWSAVIVFGTVILGVLAMEITIFGVLAGANDWGLFWTLAGIDVYILVATVMAVRYYRKRDAAAKPLQ